MPQWISGWTERLIDKQKHTNTKTHKHKHKHKQMCRSIELQDYRPYQWVQTQDYPAILILKYYEIGNVIKNFKLVSWNIYRK